MKNGNYLSITPSQQVILHGFAKLKDKVYVSITSSGDSLILMTQKTSSDNSYEVLIDQSTKSTYDSRFYHFLNHYNYLTCCDFVYHEEAESYYPIISKEMKRPT